MAGISQKEYNEQVDEALVMFGGSSPCVNIDPRMWGDFKELFKEYNEQVPKTVDWSFDQVRDWLEAYKQQDDVE
jgi:hypothetical protein